MHTLIFRLAWLAWLLYWAVTALGAKTTERSESLLSRLTYAVPLLIGLILILQPGWLWGSRLPVIAQGPSSYWTGVVLLLAGLGFCCWARTILGANWSGRVTLKSDHELIRTGAYRWVRHPIYTGLIVAFLGCAIAQGQVQCFLGVAIIAGAFIYKLRVEERMLSERFQEQYARYRKEVPALIPGVF
jgi:isoprenylcysteine carboxyl methyltransferase (ICMT) family protein YpbQ